MIDVEVEDAAWTDALPDAESLAAAAAEAALAKGLQIDSPFRFDAEQPPSAPSSGHEHASLVVLLTDDATVRDLNARFRDQDKATNVLSFPAAANAEGHLGDLALGFGVCAREAVEQGKPLSAHLQHLVAHGVLHLLGYDHMTDDEAEAMEGLERVVLAGLGIADPYAAGERDHD